MKKFLALATSITLSISLGAVALAETMDEGMTPTDTTTPTVTEEPPPPTMSCDTLKKERALCSLEKQMGDRGVSVPTCMPGELRTGLQQAYCAVKQSQAAKAESRAAHMQSQEKRTTRKATKAIEKAAMKFAKRKMHMKNREEHMQEKMESMEGKMERVRGRMQNMQEKMDEFRSEQPTGAASLQSYERTRTGFFGVNPKIFWERTVPHEATGVRRIGVERQTARDVDKGMRLRKSMIRAQRDANAMQVQMPQMEEAQ